MVTICTASLTFINSTFCPHSVFMCFVWIWEQTAIISLYNLNWLVFVTDGECLLSGTDWISLSLYIYIPGWYFSCSLSVSLAVSWIRQLLASFSLRRSLFNPRSVHTEFVVGKVTRFCPSSAVSPLSVPSHHLHAGLSRRTNEWSPPTFHKAMHFRKSVERWIETHFHLVVKVLTTLMIYLTLEDSAVDTPIKQ